MGSFHSQPVPNFQLYFEAECGSPGSSPILIGDSEVAEKIEQLIDPYEVIHHIYLYRNPLYWFQLTDLMMYHVFIVLQTDNWWWSIEKNQDNITIQRSRQQHTVIYGYRQQKRELPVTRIIMVEGNRPVRDLICFLRERGHLNKPYNLLLGNCKHLAVILLNYLNLEGKIYHFDLVGHDIQEVNLEQLA